MVKYKKLFKTYFLFFTSLNETLISENIFLNINYYDLRLRVFGYFLHLWNFNNIFL